MDRKIAVRFGPAIRADWESRDVFPFAWEAGTLMLTAEQASDLRGDLKHYADPASSDMPADIRKLYKRASVAIEKAIQTHFTTAARFVA